MLLEKGIDFAVEAGWYLAMTWLTARWVYWDDEDIAWPLAICLGLLWPIVLPTYASIAASDARDGKQRTLRSRRKPPPKHAVSPALPFLLLVANGLGAAADAIEQAETEWRREKKGPPAWKQAGQKEEPMMSTC